MLSNKKKVEFEVKPLGDEFPGLDRENRKVNLQQFKKFAKAKLKKYPLLYELILEEPETIPVEEFIMKTGVWLQILEKILEGG